MTTIGIDLGGTKIAAGRIEDGQIVERLQENINQSATSADETVTQIADLARRLITPEVSALGIGIPGLVDRDKGTAYDVYNVPHWTEVPLGPILTKELSLPVFIDNDANCFAMGEYCFGSWAGTRDFVGTTLGTGMGSGIIKDGRLLADAHSCSGEFGVIPYLDGVLEDYCAGAFFKNHYKQDGATLAALAAEGNKEALEAFAAFGTHLGVAIKCIILAVDPVMVILGGSISAAFPYFQESMWASIRDFAFPHALKDFRIEVCQTPEIAIMGAAALCS